MARFISLLVLLLLAAPGDLNAQWRCVKGIPCGNTCIAANKTCRVGSGSATSARRSAPSTARAAAVPGDAPFVASSRGRVFYSTSCSAWRRLSPANLVWFQSAEEADAAGYTPSTSAGCGPSAVPAKGAAAGGALGIAPSSSIGIPPGARYVASRRGRTFYAVRCSAWRNLVTADRVWFTTTAEALSAGLRPSNTAACGIQPEDSVSPVVKGAQ